MQTEKYFEEHAIIIGSAGIARPEQNMVHLK